VLAVIEALRDHPEGPVEIVSDSTYVVKCFHDQWYLGWKRRNWKNSKGQPVANRDLWEALIPLVLEGGRPVTFSWVKGHSGDLMNDFDGRGRLANRSTLLGRQPSPRTRRAKTRHFALQGAKPKTLGFLGGVFRCSTEGKVCG
jgi:ribonuclease HI